MPRGASCCSYSNRKTSTTTPVLALTRSHPRRRPHNWPKCRRGICFAASRISVRTVMNGNDDQVRKIWWLSRSSLKLVWIRESPLRALPFLSVLSFLFGSLRTPRIIEPWGRRRQKKLDSTSGLGGWRDMCARMLEAIPLHCDTITMHLTTTVSEKCTYVARILYFIQK